MSQWVIEALLALQWFLEDESERAYSLAIRARRDDMCRECIRSRGP
jgi:hypothetical protein